MRLTLIHRYVYKTQKTSVKCLSLTDVSKATELTHWTHRGHVRVSPERPSDTRLIRGHKTMKECQQPSVRVTLQTLLLSYKININNLISYQLTHI